MRTDKFRFPAYLPVALALAVGLMTLSVTGSLAPSYAREIAVVPPDGILHGPARVIDGDTIDISGTRIRLEGIDAPEAGQTCTSAQGQPWDCGTQATRLMLEMTRGRDVECRSHGLDRYGRLLATCFVAGHDINAAMVRFGLAWAFVRYSKAYVGEEAAARQAHAGIWQGPAQPAWEYRAARWTSAAAAIPAAQSAPQGCAIKGNVSRAGLVYHMPWSPWYDKVSMDTDKGKRWFCTEAEAQAAGWRPAMLH